MKRNVLQDLGCLGVSVGFVCALVAPSIGRDVYPLPANYSRPVVSFDHMTNSLTSNVPLAALLPGQHFAVRSQFTVPKPVRMGMPEQLWRIFQKSPAYGPHSSVRDVRTINPNLDLRRILQSRDNATPGR